MSPLPYIHFTIDLSSDTVYGADPSSHLFVLVASSIPAVFCFCSSNPVIRLTFFILISLDGLGEKKVCLEIWKKQASSHVVIIVSIHSVVMMVTKMNKLCKCSHAIGYIIYSCCVCCCMQVLIFGFVDYACKGNSNTNNTVFQLSWFTWFCFDLFFLKYVVILITPTLEYFPEAISVYKWLLSAWLFLFWYAIFYTLVSRKINKLIPFYSMDKSSIWQVLMCVSFLKCKDGRAVIIKLRFAKPQKRNWKQVRCQVLNLT